MKIETIKDVNMKIDLLKKTIKSYSINSKDKNNLVESPLLSIQKAIEFFAHAKEHNQSEFELLSKETEIQDFANCLYYASTDFICMTIRSNLRSGTELAEGEVVGIKRNEEGFFKTKFGIKSRKWIEEANNKHFNVSKGTENGFCVLCVFNNWDMEKSVLRQFA